MLDSENLNCRKHFHSKDMFAKAPTISTQPEPSSEVVVHTDNALSQIKFVSEKRCQILYKHVNICFNVCGLINVALPQIKKTSCY